MMRVLIAGASDRAVDCATRALARGDAVIVVGDPPRPHGETGRRLAGLRARGVRHLPRTDLVDVRCDTAGHVVGAVVRSRVDGAFVDEPVDAVVVADAELLGLFTPPGSDAGDLVAVHAALRAGATIREPASLRVDALTYEARGARANVGTETLAAGARVWVVDADDARSWESIPQAERTYLALEAGETDALSAIAARLRASGERAFLDLTGLRPDARGTLGRAFDFAGTDAVKHLSVAPAVRGAGRGLDRFEELPQATRGEAARRDDGSHRVADLSRALAERVERARNAEGESVDMLLDETRAAVQDALGQPRSDAELGRARERLASMARRVEGARAFDRAKHFDRTATTLLALDAALAIARVLVDAAVPVPTSQPKAAPAARAVVAAAVASSTAAPPRPRRIVVSRRDTPSSPARRETFDVSLPAGATVHDALVAIARTPTTIDGRRVDPVAWEAPCVAEQCGRCTLLVDGQARLACTTVLDEVSPKGKPVGLAPLRKLPLVRDLVVELDAPPRFTSLLTREAPTLHAPVPGDPSRSALEACIGCGACFDACPEVVPGRPFVGPAELAAAHVRTRTTLDGTRDAILEDAAGTGGVAHCGSAEVCVEVCPVDVPVFEAIAALYRDALTHVAGRT